jgi:hypothetical protein
MEHTIKLIICIIYLIQSLLLIFIKGVNHFRPHCICQTYYCHTITTCMFASLTAKRHAASKGFSLVQHGQKVTENSKLIESNEK